MNRRLICWKASNTYIQEKLVPQGMKFEEYMDLVFQALTKQDFKQVSTSDSFSFFPFLISDRINLRTLFKNQKKIQIMLRCAF